MKRNKVNRVLFKKGITGASVADAIGIPRDRFYCVVNGHQRTPWIRKKIADYLEVEPEKLWPDYKEKVYN